MLYYSLMNHERFRHSEEAKGKPNLLSDRVEKELKENPYISVVGTATDFSKSQLAKMFIPEDPKRSVPYINLKTIRGLNVSEDELDGTIFKEIYCGLKNPLYEKDELQEKLETLTKIKPTETVPFDQPYSSLRWGHQIYKEEIGNINTSINIDIEPELQKKLERFTFCSWLSKKSTLNLSQTTKVHLYPDENIAQWIYAFEQRRDLFDFREDRYNSNPYDDPWYPSDFFKSIRHSASKYELASMKNGKDLFAGYVQYRRDLLLDNYYNKNKTKIT